MLINPRILSILTTRRCTAACDHCCVGASPKAIGAIPVERIHGLIDEAKRVPSIERIVFTGGECFLLGDDLERLVGHAHLLGFETRVISNGYWAMNEKAAHERMRALGGAGLDEIMFSTGTFHQRFVPVARIVHGVRAAAAAGIAARVSIEDCDQSEFDDAILHDELAAEVAAGAVCLARDPWIADAGNRGTVQLTHDRITDDRRASATTRCEQIMTIISVTPDQKLTACCGFPMDELPALRIGSVAEHALDDVLASAPNRLLQVWLHVAGPAGIAEFVARYIPGFRLPGAASICESCVSLQRNVQAMQVISDHGMDAACSVLAEFTQLQPEPRSFHHQSSSR